MDKRSKEFESGNEQALKAAGVVDKFVNLKGEEESVPRLIFTMTLTAPAKITSTTVETSGAVIKQNGTAAQITGKLVFKGLTMDEPAGCAPPTSVTTNTLTGTVPEIGGLTYVKLAPTAGTTTPFATITLTGTCSIAGTPFKVTTSSYFCGRTEPLGTMAIAQKLEVSAAILSACGGNLSGGGNPATLQGKATYELASGESWGAK